jgi:anti-sigma factor RsiW
MNDRWSDRLSAYLDDELDQAERSAIETHLAACDECASALEALREVKSRARTLEDRPPERDLWPGIEARLAAAGSMAGGAAAAVRAARAADSAHAVVPDDAAQEIHPIRVIRPARRIDFSLPQALAAAAALVVLSAGAMWWAMRATEIRGAATRSGAAGPVALHGAGSGAAPGAASSRDQAATNPQASAAPVSGNGEGSRASGLTSPGGQPIATLASLGTSSGSRGGDFSAGSNASVGFDSSYDEAVAELQRTLEQHRTELDSSTVRIVEQNLAVIDRAILQARRALAADPSSPYLHQHLALQLKLKLDLLRRTADLAGA